MRVILTLTEGLTSEDGQIKVAEIGPAPFRVGRAPEADWTLNDPQSVISRLHFELREWQGALLVTDVSSGGTALDRPEARLRRDNPAPLPDRARLILPAGVVQVEVDRSAAGPFAGRPAAVPTPPPSGAGLPGGLGGGGARPAPATDAEAEADDVFGTRSLRARRAGGGGGAPRSDPANDPFAGSGPAAPAPRPAEPRRNPAPSLGHAATGGGRAPAPSLGGGGGSPGRAAPPPAGLGGAPAPSGLGASPPSGLGAPARPAGADPFAAPPPATPPAAPSGPASADDPFGPAPTPTPDATPAAPPSALGTPPAPASAGAAPSDPAQPPSEPPQPAAEPTVPAPAAPVDPGAEAALRAFYEAAGLSLDDIPPERRVAAAAEAGRTFQRLADALRLLLEGRAEAKRELGVAGTQIEFGANPLKVSPTPAAAVQGLLRPFGQGYLSGEAAVDDALAAMRQHQAAQITAIRAAIRIALAAFDPDELERKLQPRGLAHISGAARRAALWEKFREDYGRFAEQANDDIRMVFGRELDRLYAKPGQGGDEDR